MAGKRANGEGTIFKRPNGKGWQGQVTIGRDPATGKLKRLTFYGKSQKEVQKKISDVQAQMNMGTFIEPHKITMGQWIDNWLPTYKFPPKVKLSTYVSYEMLTRRHIKPILGEILLTELRTDTLQRFFNDKFLNGKSDGSGGGLSPKTLKNLKNLVHEALQQALYNGLISKNVSEATVLPKGSNRKAIKILSKEEQKRFLRLIENEKLRAAYYLLLGSGMRMGELLALTWDEVDVKTGIVKIRRTLNRLKTFDPNSPTKTKLIFQEPKTSSGNRDVPIAPNIVKELIKHYERQQDEKAIAGELYASQGLVFATGIGTPIEPRVLIRDLHHICKKNNIPRISIHSLRHTYASRLLEGNQHPKIVQELLGHSNISITLDTYSHVLPEIKTTAAHTLDDLFDSPNDNNEGS